MGCDIIDLQATRRSGQSAFLEAGYVVYCSSESGGDGEGKKGQGGVGLAVRKSISPAEARPPEFIDDRLLKVTLESCGRTRAVTFVVGYAPTDTQSVGEKYAFWTALERVVKEVAEHEQLFVLMDPKMVATSLSAYGEARNLLPEEHCGFRPHRSTTDMMSAVRRPQELGRKARVPLFLCFIDLQKAYDSVNRTLLWQVLTRFGVPPQMIERGDPPIPRWDESMRAE